MTRLADLAPPLAALPDSDSPPAPELLAQWRARAAAFHEDLVAERGAGWQAFWGSRDSQRARYQVLMDELPLERIWRDARVERIWEGTSEMQRLIVARALERRGLDALLDA